MTVITQMQLTVMQTLKKTILITRLVIKITITLHPSVNFILFKIKQN